MLEVQNAVLGILVSPEKQLLLIKLRTTNSPVALDQEKQTRKPRGSTDVRLRPALTHPTCLGLGKFSALSSALG